MKTGAGLLLIGLGAILAFAVTTSSSVFNVHTAGWVIMLVGVLGLVLPRRARGWVGRRLSVRRAERRMDGRVEEVTYPPYMTRDRAGLPPGPGSPVPEGTPDETLITEDIYEQ